MTIRTNTATLLAAVLLFAGIELVLAHAQEAEAAQAQDAALAQESPALPEVRQLVTFRFQPGKTGEALSIFKERALPLHEANEAMLFFRGFLVSDGWHYLRFLGFESLGDYHDTWTRMRSTPLLPRSSRSSSSARGSSSLR